MKMIALADLHNGIGKDGRQIVYIPEDLARFKALTLGHSVIFGRKTLACFPAGRPLAGRRNLILSRRADFSVIGAEVFSSVSSLVRAADSDAFVIGGESVYRQLLPYCDTVYLTRVYEEYEADRFFPALDDDPDWGLTAQSEPMHSGTLRFCYLTYQRKNPDFSEKRRNL